MKIAIIGGGPAGFMAAISAAENSDIPLSIDIIEKNDPLKTILYTGGGRCNITNAIYDYKELASNYPRGEKFLYSAFSKFGLKETINWFNKHGAQLYTQDDNRVFPKSDDANTIRDILIKRARELNINIKAHTPVLAIEYNNGKFIVNTGKSIEEYDKLIISTGGNYKSRPSGYDFAIKLGHKVTKLKPSLSGLFIKEKWLSKLAGVTINNAEIKIFYKEKLISKKNGDFVFTHKGLSGPLAFKISSICAFLDYDEFNPLRLKINYIPERNVESLEKELLEEFDKNSKKDIQNILIKFCPKSLIQVLLESKQLDLDKKASQITKEERKIILKLLTENELSFVSTVPDGEIVTAGGIELNEINPKTMESKLIKGLYFCGEILNIDGFTGGFNLQAAWSTGYIAGIDILKSI